MLFGGGMGTGQYHEFTQPLGDTWTWDGAHWNAVQTGTAPIARAEAAMVYDAARGVAFLHGGNGANYAFVNDFWAWNGTRWALLGPTQSPPASDVYQLQSQPMAWDGTGKVVVLFDWSGPAMNAGPNQIWAWDGTNWSLVPATTPPSGHENHPSAIAYDATRKVTVFFGHVGTTPTTWTFDGAAWKQVATSGSSSEYFTIAPDPAHGDVVLFGELGDTWTWDGTKWTPQNPAHAPSARRGAAMTYDPLLHAVMLFGGTTGTAAGARDQGDLWSWNGTDWAQLS